MKPYVYKEGMSAEEQKDGAYWERNMLALALAVVINDEANTFLMEEEPLPCGWYVHGEWEGWSRVISIGYGTYTFHVPDDFDLGDLKEIEPNWDGHTTEEKWITMMKSLGCKVD